jgi:hypothetical protein
MLVAGDSQPAGHLRAHRRLRRRQKPRRRGQRPNRRHRTHDRLSINATPRARSPAQGPPGRRFFTPQTCPPAVMSSCPSRAAGDSTDATVPMLAEPTSDQREALELIGTAIPLTLK